MKVLPNYKWHSSRWKDRKNYGKYPNPVKDRIMLRSGPFALAGETPYNQDRTIIYPDVYYKMPWYKWT